jgi:hypothetical protein
VLTAAEVSFWESVCVRVSSTSNNATLLV